MRMMPTFALVLLLGLGCRGGEDEPQETPEPINFSRSRILDSVPVMPNSRIMDTTGTNEAEQRQYLVGTRVDSVVRYYRAALRPLGWTMINDNSDSLQGNLYLSKGRASLWITARPFANLSTTYTLLATDAIRTSRDTARGPSPR